VPPQFGRPGNILKIIQTEQAHLVDEVISQTMTEQLLLLKGPTSTGYRRLIGCLKLRVIFRKRATNIRALLRKMTCKDKASYGFPQPCKTLRKVAGSQPMCICMYACVCIYMYVYIFFCNYIHVGISYMYVLNCVCILPCLCQFIRLLCVSLLCVYVHVCMCNCVLIQSCLFQCVIV